MKYYIADPHFFHGTVEDMDHRGFVSQLEMHEYMISQWNSRVTDEDDVYIVGDCSFGRGVETWKVLSRLNGRIFMIEGNHDYWFLDDREFVDTFEEVAVYTEITDNGRTVILCHYPMPFYNGQFRKDRDDNDSTFMVHGHIHNTYDEYLLFTMIRELAAEGRDTRETTMVNTPFHLLNVFCMYSDYVPLTLDEWQQKDSEIRKMIEDEEKRLDRRLTSEDWDKLNLEMVEKFTGRKPLG